MKEPLLNQTKTFVEGQTIPRTGCTRETALSSLSYWGLVRYRGGLDLQNLTDSHNSNSTAEILKMKTEGNRNPKGT